MNTTQLTTALGRPLTPAEVTALQAYVALLLKWNAAINLIGKSTEAEVWERHIADCAQLVPDVANTPTLLDMGSGAGLPAVVLAILSPNTQVTACERVGRKADFLKECRRALSLTNLTVVADDVRTLKGQTFATITARAVATLTELFDATAELCAPDGQFVFLKGATVDDELATLREKYQVTTQMRLSITGGRGTIIQLKRI
ncbi:MAG: 16S rRNA (guanine(527)-N(7))-methyltransferase RsmG [Alphaproteobacteria bacterium]